VTSPSLAVRSIREPFNGISHGLGAVLSLAGLVVLVGLARGRPWHTVAFLVYGASMIVLYTASTLYHSLHGGPDRLRKLMIFDQSAIFALIAGTYTPFCLVGLRGPGALALLATVWAIALTGIALRVFWRAQPAWVPVVLYLAMGWVVSGAFWPLMQTLPSGALGWIFQGGLCYTVGCVVFAAKRPRLWPGVFSSHELWHLFVLAGSACHFVAVLYFLALR
jgi:hemolysin III